MPGIAKIDRKSTRLNSSHANIYTLSLHDALPILMVCLFGAAICLIALRNEALLNQTLADAADAWHREDRSEEHTSELQSRQYLHSFPTRRSSDLDGLSVWRRHLPDRIAQRSAVESDPGRRSGCLASRR